MIEKIYELGREIFDDEIHLGAKFNEAISDGDYGRARVITEAMMAIFPNDNRIVKLDGIISELNIKSKKNG